MCKVIQLDGRKPLIFSQAPQQKGQGITIVIIGRCVLRPDETMPPEIAKEASAVGLDMCLSGSQLPDLLLKTNVLSDIASDSLSSDTVNGPGVSHVGIF